MMTPFTSKDEINERVLRELAKFQISAGVDGLWLCGGSAEAALLNLDERKRIVEITADEVSGSAEIIVHTGALAQRDVIKLIHHADRIGVSAIAAIPPHFYKTDQLGIKSFYEAVAGETRLPFFIYHVPGLTNVTVGPKVVKDLLHIPNLSGIKYSDYNLFEMESILKLHNYRLSVLSGNDEVLLAALSMGAHGGVGLTYNYLPGAFVNLYRAFQTGLWEEAQKLQGQINDVIRQTLKFGPYACMKWIVKQMGFECGECRAPIRPLTDEEEAMLRKNLCKTDLLAEVLSQR